MATYVNQTNGYTERVGPAWLWVLLFGALYFAYRGMWRHAILLFLLVLPTFGIAWVYYILTARRHVERHYLERGWAQRTR